MNSGDQAAQFSFGQIDAMLADAHKVLSHKRGAFTARLKSLQDHGLPRREKPGRGKAASYRFSQVVQIAVGVALLRSGFPPSLASITVEENWHTLRCSIADILEGDQATHIWSVYSDSFAELAQENFISRRETGLEIIKVDATTVDDLTSLIGPSGLFRHLAHGNVVTMDIAEAATNYGGDIEAFFKELSTEASDWQRMNSEFQAIIKSPQTIIDTFEDRQNVSRALGTYLESMHPKPNIPSKRHEILSMARDLSSPAKEFIKSRKSDPMKLETEVFRELMTHGIILPAGAKGFWFTFEQAAADIITQLRSDGVQ